VKGWNLPTSAKLNASVRYFYKDIVTSFRLPIYTSEWRRYAVSFYNARILSYYEYVSDNWLFSNPFMFLPHFWIWVKCWRRYLDLHNAISNVTFTDSPVSKCYIHTKTYLFSLRGATTEMSLHSTLFSCCLRLCRFNETGKTQSIYVATTLPAECPRNRASTSSRGNKFIFFSKASQPKLLPVQPHIQWVPADAFIMRKPAGAWSWPLTSMKCPGKRYVELNLHSLLRLHSEHRDNFTFITVIIIFIFSASYQILTFYSTIREIKMFIP
jgi:hypothetical protein